jgi:hypothetical protein
VAQLYSRRVTEVDQVLKLVQFPSMADGELLPIIHTNQEVLEVDVPYDGLRLKVLAAQFMKHFARYMHGSGYPDHPLYNDLVDPEKRKQAKIDATFRARQFLSQMSGTIFLDSPPREMEVSPFFALIF